MKFRASPLTTEGYFLFSYLINKPWCKMQIHSLGVLTAFAYLNLLAYRRASPEEKSGSFSFVHWVQQRKWVGNLLILFSLVMVLTSFTSAWRSNQNAYKVDFVFDVLYYGFARFLLVAGALIILFLSFMGHYKTLVSTFMNEYVRAFGRLSYTMGLITPIVIIMFYCSQETAIFLYGPTSTMFAIGHMVSNMLTGLFMFLVIEYPLAQLVNFVIVKRISHQNMLRRHFKLQAAQLQEDAQLAAGRQGGAQELKLAQMPHLSKAAAKHLELKYKDLE